MFNANNRTHLDRLSRAVDFSRWRLEPFRINRMHFLRQFVGAHYSYSGSPQRVPLNLLQLAHNIYLRQLVARAPRAMVTAKDPQLKPIAADMEAWMDKATVGMRLAESLRLCVANALHSIGIMKVGEARAGEMDFFGTSVAVGQPFAEAVDFDDWVHDITAKRYDQVQFAGNRYRVSLEEAQENPDFDKESRQKLSAQTRFAYNERGDPRSTTLSQSTMQLYDEYQDHVELWDMWLPKEKLVLVMPYQESVEGGFGNVRPLKVIKWEGPPEGPFVVLSYCDVPNNIMPAAPMQALMDLHDSANLAWRKVIRQIERQKKIFAFQGVATDDAERINRTSDGESVRVDMPDRTREVNLGGVDPPNLASAMQLVDRFVYMAGNLDTLGGLSPQAQTLGQDEMLNKNGSSQVAEMQDRTITFAQEVYGRLGFWWWTNPVLTYEASRNVAGLDIPVNITPQMRQIPFNRLNFEIDPYSMQHSTPQAKLSAVMNIVQTLILPAMPILQQQGVTLKAPELLKLLAELGDLPQLADILAVGPPPSMQGPMQMAQQAAQGAGGGQPPPGPPVTTRRNVRTNIPGGTRQGQSAMMQQALMGGGGANNGMAGGNGR